MTALFREDKQGIWKSCGFSKICWFLAALCGI